MANDTTIRMPWANGANTLYTQIYNSSLFFWNGTAYVAAVLANWATYAVATPEIPAGFGIRVCQFPITSPVGNYTWSIFLQSGGSPLSGDVRIGGGEGYWNGSTFGAVSSVTGDVTLAPSGMDKVILEPATGSTPQINARQGMALAYIAAPGGLVTGVMTENPVRVYNPDGSIQRLTITSDPNGNRSNVVINNMP